MCSRKLSFIMLLFCLILLTSCGHSVSSDSFNQDVRTKEEKLADNLYEKGKDAFKDAGYISDEKAAEIDNAYGSVKDAVKSVKGLFDN